MIPLQLFPDMATTGPWNDIEPNSPDGVLERIGLLRNGTAGGRASVALVVRLPDGTAVIAQTTWRLFHNAARALAQSPAVREEVAD